VCVICVFGVYVIFVFVFCLVLVTLPPAKNPLSVSNKYQICMSAVAQLLGNRLMHITLKM
jgi:hypothetical protein